MTSVEGDSITGHEAAHDLTQRGRPGAHEEVKMVRQKRPRVTLGLSLFKDIGKALKKSFPVFVVFEDVTAFDSPCHDVL